MGLSQIFEIKKLFGTIDLVWNDPDVNIYIALQCIVCSTMYEILQESTSKINLFECQKQLFNNPKICSVLMVQFVFIF